ncbi:MAG TPA: hypothetical protein DIC53_05445 [Synergistaceae bacterium]|jgi:hypothetical protein|nr:hypothetical protein [Synergistaceae bacterium]
MRRTSLLFVVLALVTLLFAARVEAVWDGSYVNGRFGWSVTVPAEFGMDPAPDNDDGRRFYDRDGCSITVWGEHNVLEATLESAMEEEEGNFDSVASRKKGDEWFILSGDKGENTLCVKRYVGEGAIYTLQMEYPSELREHYDPLVAEVLQSFSPGGMQ